MPRKVRFAVWAIAASVSGVRGRASSSGCYTKAEHSCHSKSIRFSVHFQHFSLKLIMNLLRAFTHREGDFLGQFAENRRFCFAQDLLVTLGGTFHT